MDKVENLFEVMYKRRSIRKYVEDKTVDAEHVAVISIICFGYPEEERAPRTQYAEEAIYWQKYGPQR